MMFFSIKAAVRSGLSRLCSASYSGRKYGSTFCCRSPGRKPKRSPASTAGLVRMIRSTLRSCRQRTACTTAKKVLPVPAGPSDKVRSWRSMASTYCFCRRVRGRSSLPFWLRASTCWLRSRCSSLRPVSRACRLVWMSTWVTAWPSLQNGRNSSTKPAARSIWLGRPSMKSCSPRSTRLAPVRSLSRRNMISP